MPNSSRSKVSFFAVKAKARVAHDDGEGCGVRGQGQWYGRFLLQKASERFCVSLL